MTIPTPPIDWPPRPVCEDLLIEHVYHHDIYNISKLKKLLWENNRPATYADAEDLRLAADHFCARLVEWRHLSAERLAEHTARRLRRRK